MAFDPHANFAYGIVATAPSPASSGTSLVLSTGQGALMPAPPFNAVVWPAGVSPLSTNAEIVRVTNVVGNTLTIVRGPQASDPGGILRSIVAGDQFSEAITGKMFSDIESAVNLVSPMTCTGPGGSPATFTGSTLTLPAPRGIDGFRLFWGVMNASSVSVTLPQPVADGAFVLRLDQDSLGGRQLVFASNPTVNDPTGLLNITANVALGILSAPFATNWIRFESDGFSWYAFPDTAGTPSANQADQIRASISDPWLREAQAGLTSSGQALTGTPIIDTYQTVVGDPILRAVSPPDANNGIWVIQSGAWARRNDYYTGMTFRVRMVAVAGGSVNAGTFWICNSTSLQTVDTTSTTWTKKI